MYSLLLLMVSSPLCYFRAWLSDVSFSRIVDSCVDIFPSPSRQMSVPLLQTTDRITNGL